MKNIPFVFCTISIFALNVIHAKSLSEDFGATAETVGRHEGGIETPENQRVTPVDDLVELPGSQPDFTPFNAVSNNVPLDEMNPEPRKIADSQLRRDALVSAKLPLEKEDQCPEDLFNHILWRAMKGSKTVPFVGSQRG